MPEPKDDLSPSSKDPTEGAGGRNNGAEPAAPSGEEESHLGAGGDAAEGELDVSQA